MRYLLYKLYITFILYPLSISFHHKYKILYFLPAELCQVLTGRIWLKVLHFRIANFFSAHPATW